MKKLLFVLLFTIVIPYVKAQPGYVPTKENLEARQWFEEARFGLFIHWGVYSVLGDGEWVMNNQNIPVEAYEKIPAFFNPQNRETDQCNILSGSPAVP